MGQSSHRFSLYRRMVRPILFLFDSETIHRATIRFCRAISFPALIRQLARLLRVDDPRLRTRVFGIDFPNPVGLGAGFDKNAELIEFMPALGFGFMEVGTITAHPQAGNPRPRLFRLPQDAGLINRLGFNNEGVEALSQRLASRRAAMVLGANIGRSKIVSNEEAFADYARSFEAVRPHVDFVVINVSSPNTPDLRELQDKKPLEELLTHIQSLNKTLPCSKPILLKIAPDLNTHQLDDIVEVARHTNISALIATNTTIGRPGLATPSGRVAALGAGGLSGKPLQSASTEIIRYLYKKTAGAIPLIGVGGIFTAEDAYEKIKAGASLVEVYTGLIYQGPAIAADINKGILELLVRDGFHSITEAVGVET